MVIGPYPKDLTVPDENPKVVESYLNCYPDAIRLSSVELGWRQLTVNFDHFSQFERPGGPRGLLPRGSHRSVRALSGIRLFTS